MYVVGLTIECFLLNQSEQLNFFLSFFYIIDVTKQRILFVSCKQVKYRHLILSLVIYVLAHSTRLILLGQNINRFNFFERKIS